MCANFLWPRKKTVIGTVLITEFSFKNYKLNLFMLYVKHQRLHSTTFSNTKKGVENTVHGEVLYFKVFRKARTVPKFYLFNLE